MSLEKNLTKSPLETLGFIEFYEDKLQEFTVMELVYFELTKEGLKHYDYIKKWLDKNLLEYLETLKKEKL